MNKFNADLSKVDGLMDLLTKQKPEVEELNEEEVLELEARLKTEYQLAFDLDQD